MTSTTSAYDNWTREDLITRLAQLDRASSSTTQPPAAAAFPSARKLKEFNFSAHPCRKIALKFSYNGSDYSGLEYQKPPTSLPTVEGVLFDALAHTRLIDPTLGFEGCGWEKCGRTDRGVSAAGQVISLRIRSALEHVEGAPSTLCTKKPVDKAEIISEMPSSGDAEDGPGLEGDLDFVGNWDEPPTNVARPSIPKATSEMHYVSLLNNILPPTIRIIAWSPVAPDFSARFSCRYRHYKYFFNPEGLDLAAMQDAATRLVGEHDFRNLCKIDPSKQLTSFTRKIVSADINRASADGRLYVLDLVGTAFLYNQVRHIMAVLFLVGTGLEHPYVVDALLNVDPAHPHPPRRAGEPVPPVLTSKPEYQMGDPLPLMLWECGYDTSTVSWRTDDAPEPDGVLSHRELSRNLYHSVQSLYERSVIQTALDGHFLRAVAAHHSPPPQYFPVGRPGVQPIAPGNVLSVPLGAGTFRRGAKYVPLVERPRGALAEEVNERWRLGKGARQLERRALAVQGSS